MLDPAGSPLATRTVATPGGPLPFSAVATPPVLLPVPVCAEDFDTARLLREKQEQGLTVSVCLPARDEEATVGQIVATVRRTLMEAVPLVDEVVVLDDGSIDSTAEVATWEGARVIAAEDILPEAGPRERQGQCHVEVAPGHGVATSCAGSMPISATSATTSSPA